ncbi:MAG: hypothetical protein ACP5NS_04380 [Candidatus Pacearchaeota archaeon]
MKYLIKILEGVDAIVLNGHFRSRAKSSRERVERHTAEVRHYRSVLGELRQKNLLDDNDIRVLNEIERYVHDQLDGANRYCQRRLPKDIARVFDEHCRELRTEYLSNYSI